MSKSYKAAPDADRIAHELLSDVHDHLAEFPVRCIFQDEPDKIKGREALATIRKLGGLQAFLAGSVELQGLQECLDLDLPAEFSEPRDILLICIWHLGWTRLTADQKMALIDHELCHARTVEDEKTGDRRVVIVGHDCEEFFSVIHRHGDWKGEIAMFQPKSKAKAS